MAPIGRRVLAALVPALLLAGLLVLVAAPDSPASPDLFVTMPDGVQLAVGLHMPPGFTPGAPAARKYPTIFEFSGYDGGSAQGGTLSKEYGGDGAPLSGDSAQLTDHFNDQYVIVHASVRGTGCSGGEFDLFGTQNGIDGRYLVDQWIPRQPWSNGDVAIVGHSYSGITGFQVAATPAAPNTTSHLLAVSVSGLIDDLYRGIVYPGGVQDYGFPLLWTGAIRPAYDVGGGLLPGLVRSPDDNDPGGYPDDPNRQQECAQNATTKSRTITNDPLVQGLASTDNDWYRSRSMINYADKITVPLHITGAYQDEQTGPRGPTHLWQAAVNAPFKRLLLLNGNHDSQNPGSTGTEVWQDRKAFIDKYLLGSGRGYPPKSVSVLWDWHRDSTGHLIANARTDAKDWPLPGTAFTDWYLQPGGGLAPAAPTGSATYQYVTGTGRQSWSYQAGPTAGSPITTHDGPDQVIFSSNAIGPDGLAIHGPMTATLWVASTAPDTDLFVEVADDAPDGSRTFLQRGMLKASHRAVDEGRSDKLADGRIYRPWRPHSNPQPITPGDVNEYLVEIFPVGHIFRAGHKLTVLVHAPPMVDSYYAYGPTRAPAGVNTIYVDPQHPSRIMIPQVAMPAGRDPRFDPKCGDLEAVRCVPAP